jgi:trehalose 2-sulfotransferase
VSEASGYLLCGTPRTGSTLLCGLLTSTGVLGRPRSWFRKPDEVDIARELGVPVARGGPENYRQYVQAVGAAGRTPNGVFAARVMWGSLAHVITGLADPATTCDLDVLQAALGPLIVVHLRRTDVVGQAVSWCRAEQTGYWQRGDTVGCELSEDIGQLLEFVHTICEHEEAWREWFDRNDVKPVELTYEGLIDDPASAVGQIAKRLGVLLRHGWRPRPTDTRQADDVNRRWAAALWAALETEPEHRSPQSDVPMSYP